jgi:acetolactate synthase-1/2/3 large subunit
VLALVGDGSAMYTIQALWTMAREKLNVVAVVLNNRSYAILNVELQRVGAASAGPKAKGQLDLGDPALDFVQMAQGMGVPAVRATTTRDLVAALERAFRTPGPHLIEAVVPSAISGLKLSLLPHVLGSLAGLPAPLARALKRRLAP